MTPDGIATGDWDQVHELALAVVNSSGAGDVDARNQASRDLIELLDELQKKYGPLPSLLATRADYMEAFQDREYWLLAAYKQAVDRCDGKNLVWIAESLASLYVDNPHWAEAEEWVARLEEHLKTCPEPYEAEEAVRIRGLLASRAAAAAEQRDAADKVRG